MVREIYCVTKCGSTASLITTELWFNASHVRSGGSNSQVNTISALLLFLITQLRVVDSAGGSVEHPQLSRN